MDFPIFVHCVHVLSFKKHTMYIARVLFHGKRANMQYFDVNCFYHLTPLNMQWQRIKNIQTIWFDNKRNQGFFQACLINDLHQCGENVLKQQHKRINFFIFCLSGTVSWSFAPQDMISSIWEKRRLINTIDLKWPPQIPYHIVPSSHLSYAHIECNIDFFNSLSSTNKIKKWSNQVHTHLQLYSSVIDNCQWNPFSLISLTLGQIFFWLPWNAVKVTNKLECPFSSPNPFAYPFCFWVFVRYNTILYASTKHTSPLT